MFDKLRIPFIPLFRLSEEALRIELSEHEVFADLDYGRSEAAAKAWHAATARRRKLERERPTIRSVL